MREKIEKAIEYLKRVSIQEPFLIRVEECEIDRVVLSFEYQDNTYAWQQRIMKEFKFGENLLNGEVISMTNFNNPI